MNTTALFSLLFAASCLGQAEPMAPIPLWADGAPGALGKEDHDIPTLTPYLADPAQASGACIVICPGGGYGGLADHEGRDYALWLNQHGVAGLVLNSTLSHSSTGG